VATKCQLINKVTFSKIKKQTRIALDSCPQKKAVCLKVLTVSPKKPSSASRKVVKVVLLSSKRKIFAHIPGIKHSLQRYSTVLIRGGRVKDLPGMRYRVVRGVFDLHMVYDRFKARSKYGVPHVTKN